LSSFHFLIMSSSLKDKLQGLYLLFFFWVLVLRTDPKGCHTFTEQTKENHFTNFQFSSR
jgi:hypothetical protein